MEDQGKKDGAVLAHIERLVSEEHRLFDHGELDDEQARRLVAVQTELDQCWDLLRQRRALRETGGDPASAHVRTADVVKKYVG
jgi:ABC-type phosphate transport system auxiliary subunit